ncbi:hypothetical protein HEP74_01549 [Xanthomonas sp. SS]|nr:hypothetical protein HEP74_01549 [Xanthomonas sp. SS]
MVGAQVAGLDAMSRQAPRHKNVPCELVASHLGV